MGPVSVKFKHDRYLVIKRQEPIDRVFDRGRLFCENFVDQPSLSGSDWNIQVQESHANLLGVKSLAVDAETATLDILFCVKFYWHRNNKDKLWINLKTSFDKFSLDSIITLDLDESRSEFVMNYHYLIISLDLKSRAISYQTISLPFCSSFMQSSNYGFALNFYKTCKRHFGFDENMPSSMYAGHNGKMLKNGVNGYLYGVLNIQRRPRRLFSFAEIQFPVDRSQDGKFSRQWQLICSRPSVCAG